MSQKVVYFGRDLIEAGEDFVVAKVVDTTGSTPRKKGAWLLMKKDGTKVGTVGGGKLEAEAERLALETFKTKESKIYHFSLSPVEQGGLDMRCGGDADISVEYIDANNPSTFDEDFGRETTAYIFGAGHVGLALEPILRYVDFSTVVLDDRKDYANEERFPEAKGVKVIENFEKAYDDLTTDKDSYIVIVTRGHAGDYDVLKQALRNPYAYIGMIGSRSKVATLMKMLDDDGFTEEEKKRVHTPVGIDIKAETPEEIAISIAAEMIEVRASGETYGSD